MAHLKLPAPPVHPVRAQNRPDHGEGTSTDLDAPVANSNPVVDKAGLEAAFKVAGHTVNWHLFVKLMVIAFPPARNNVSQINHHI